MNKRYGKPNTPCRRPLENPAVAELARRRLKRQYAELNPSQLRREILDLQDRLHGRFVFKKENGRKEV